MEQKICVNSDCNRKFRVMNLKKIIANKNYDLCGTCRKFEKTCKTCDKKIYNQGVTCSKECAYELKKKSWIETCGSPHNFSKESSSRKKWEKRLLDEEGIINVWQRESVKEHNKKTFLIKYGVDNPSKADIIKKQKKDTFFKNYGVNSIFEIKNYKNLNISYVEYWNNFMMNKYGKLAITNPEKISNTRILNRDKIRASLEKQGLWIPLSELSEWQIYLHNVGSFTRENLRKYGELKFGNKWWIQTTKDRKEVLSMDHMYSKKQGFIDKIPPEIIGNIVNLDLIKFSNNASKGAKCSISKENLYLNFNKLKEYENKESHIN